MSIIDYLNFVENDFDISIKNMGLLCVSNKNFVKLEVSYNLTRIEK